MSVMRQILGKNVQLIRNTNVSKLLRFALLHVLVKQAICPLFSSFFNAEPIACSGNQNLFVKSATVDTRRIILECMRKITWPGKGNPASMKGSQQQDSIFNFLPCIDAIFILQMQSLSSSKNSSTYHCSYLLTHFLRLQFSEENAQFISSKFGQ